MKDKKMIYNINKKVVQFSIDRASKVLIAFKRDNPIELVVDPK